MKSILKYNILFVFLLLFKLSFSKIDTTVVCGVSSNINLISYPGYSINPNFNFSIKKISLSIGPVFTTINNSSSTYKKNKNGFKLSGMEYGIQFFPSNTNKLNFFVEYNYINLRLNINSSFGKYIRTISQENYISYGFRLTLFSKCDIRSTMGFGLLSTKSEYSSSYYHELGGIFKVSLNYQFPIRKK